MICCNRISIGYDRPIFENITFKINEKDFLIIKGQNGTGKSTLLKTILGLRKPIDGEIVLSGIEKNEIGYLPQISEVNIEFPATVYEIVLSRVIKPKKECSILF